MVRKLIVVLCLCSLVGVISAGCHADVETERDMARMSAWGDLEVKRLPRHPRLTAAIA